MEGSTRRGEAGRPRFVDPLTRNLIVCSAVQVSQMQGKEDLNTFRSTNLSLGGEGRKGWREGKRERGIFFTNLGSVTSRVDGAWADRGSVFSVGEAIGRY